MRGRVSGNRLFVHRIGDITWRRDVSSDLSQFDDRKVVKIDRDFSRMVKFLAVSFGRAGKLSVR